MGKEKKMDRQDLLAKFFGSKSRASILAFLHADPNRAFYQREILFETGLSLRPLQRELVNLADLGIIRKEVTANRVYYRIDSSSPFFSPIRQILRSASSISSI